METSWGRVCNRIRSQGEIECVMRNTPSVILNECFLKVKGLTVLCHPERGRSHRPSRSFALAQNRRALRMSARGRDLRTVRSTFFKSKGLIRTARRSSKRSPRFDFQKSAIRCRFLKVRLETPAPGCFFAQDDTRGALSNVSIFLKNKKTSQK